MNKITAEEFLSIQKEMVRKIREEDSADFALLSNAVEYVPEEIFKKYFPKQCQDNCIELFKDGIYSMEEFDEEWINFRNMMVDTENIAKKLI